MRTELYLIRHGEYEQNEKKSLSDVGLHQARELADRLTHTRITRIISSPILRAVQTAEPLATALNIGIEKNDAFTEFFSDLESFYEALERIEFGILDVVRAYEGENIAIFSHGFTVGEFLKKIGYGTAEELPVGSVKSGAYAHIVHENIDGNDTFVVEDVFKIEKVTS